jgi:hypothetical protein
METTTTYFDKPGRDNTDAVMKLAAARAAALGVKSVVVATNTLATAFKALDAFQGCTIVAITHVTGFTGPDKQEFTPEDRQRFEEKGGLVQTAAHAFGGLQRSLAREGTYPAPGLSIGDVIAQSLRTFGQGTKVALEIATMAADAGYIRTDEDCIAIGGSGGGADTALVIRPNYTHKFFQSKVREIICKPRL